MPGAACVDEIECICSWPRSSADSFFVVFPFCENSATRDASICISIIRGDPYVIWVLSPADSNPMQVRAHLRLLTRDLSSFSYSLSFSFSLFFTWYFIAPQLLDYHNFVIVHVSYLFVEYSNGKEERSSRINLY